MNGEVRQLLWLTCFFDFTSEPLCRSLRASLALPPSLFGIGFKPDREGLSARLVFLYAYEL